MASDLELDYYSILDIKPDATKSTIKEAYHRLALRDHPDKNPKDVDRAKAAFQKLQEAYETLKDENKRILYDARFTFLRRDFSRAPSEDSLKKNAENALRERMKREKREREWMETERVAMENIVRLEKEIEALLARIKKLRMTME